MSYLLQVHQGSSLVVGKKGSKLSATVGVHAHDVLEKSSVVGRVSNLVGIENNLGVLLGLCKAGNDLVGNIGTKVY